MHSVSAIVVNYRTADLTCRCLKSIAGFNSRVSDCILFDNSPKQDAEKMFSVCFPGLKYLSSDSNLGFGRACNLAAAQAQGDFLFLLNSDAVLLEDSIETMLHEIKNSSKIAVIGCRIIDEESRVQPSAANFPSLLRVAAGREITSVFFRKKWPFLSKKLTYFILEEDLLVPRKVDWCIGAALLIRKDVFFAVKGFDARIFLYGEEMDLCKKIHDLGYETFYTPKTTVLHQRAASSGGRFQKERIAWVSAGQRYYYRKHFSLFKAVLFYSTEIIASAFKSLIWLITAAASKPAVRAARLQKARWHFFYLIKYFSRSY